MWKSKHESPSGPWGISVITPKKKIMKVVERREGESLKGCLERAKKAARTLREKYAGRDDITIGVVSRLKAFPMPDKVKLKRNQMWCPYCVKPREFKKGQLVEHDGISFLSDYRRCVVCGMSDNDFYVKTYNHLWHNSKETKVKGK